MLNEVVNTVRLKGEEFIQSEFLDKENNGKVITKENMYLLKYQKEPFYGAGQILFGHGGIGVNIHENIFHDFITQTAYFKQTKNVLFQWEGSGIYHITAVDLLALCEKHTSKSGVVTKVVLVRDLKRW